MKKIALITITLIYCSQLIAQVPQKFSYQAVVRNAANALVTNTAVGMRISILQGSATGTVVYSETQKPTTSTNGLISISVGAGTVLSGKFAGIDWSKTPYFLKSETDITGGTNYNITGTSELLSVPFALMAGGFISTNGGTITNLLNESKTASLAFIDDSTHKVFAYSSVSNNWVAQSYTNYYPSITKFNGNFLFIDDNIKKVFVFSNSGTWVAQSYTNYSPSITIDSSNGNFIFIDDIAKTINVFDTKNSLWNAQTYTNYYPSLIVDNGTVLFVDDVSKNVLAFSSIKNSWQSQPYTNYSPSIIKANGFFFFIDDIAKKVLCFNTASGVWSSQVYVNSYQPSLIISGKN